MPRTFRALAVASALVFPGAAFAGFGLPDPTVPENAACQAQINSVGRELIKNFADSNGGGLGQLKQAPSFLGDIPTNEVAEFRNEVRNSFCNPS
jgi:hypothetical protein